MEGEGEDHTAKRELLQVLSFTESNGIMFTCNIETLMKIPYDDCFNLLLSYCTEGSPAFKSQCDCTQKVLQVRNNLNSNWQTFVNGCAKFAKMGGSYPSETCASAMNKTKTEIIYLKVGGQSIVPASLFDSATKIWNYDAC